MRHLLYLQVMGGSLRPSFFDGMLMRNQGIADELCSPLQALDSQDDEDIGMGVSLRETTKNVDFTPTLNVLRR